MASMTIRDLDERLKARLRVRAAQHGRSMEEEARDILRAALAKEPAGTQPLADAIRARIGPLGGLEICIPPHEPIRDPSAFEP